MQQYGKYNAGTIISMDSIGNNLKVEYNFRPSTFSSSAGSDLIQHPNGKLYGLANGYGTISDVLFEFDTSNGAFIEKVLFKANGTSPLFAIGKLAISKAGNIYGVTRYGGAHGKGMLYKYNPKLDSFRVLHDFMDSSGRNPISGVICDGNKLYGSCAGGKYNRGLVFEYNILTHSYKAQFHYNGPTDRTLSTGLIMLGNGKLLATAVDWNGYITGSFFQLDTSNFSISGHCELDSVLGFAPYGELHELSNGAVVGLASSYHSKALIVYNSSSYQLDTLVDKDSFGHSVWKGPYLLGKSSQGKVYFSLDDRDADQIFSIDSSLKIENVVNIKESSTRYRDYQTPWVFTSDDKIYGVSSRLDAITYAALVEINQKTWQVRQVFDFLNNPNGTLPNGALIPITTNTYYGVTFSGGDLNAGVVYEYNSNLKTVKGISSFTAEVPGYDMIGDFEKVGSRYLYGVTSTRSGLIFRYDRVKQVIEKMYEFSHKSINSPSGGLLYASNGKLYGLTSRGGSNELGGIYEYNPDSNTFRVSFEFDTLSGYMAQGKLKEFEKGKFIGGHPEGGKNFSGVLFEYDIENRLYSKLHDNELEYWTFLNILKVGSLIYMVGAENSTRRSAILVYDMTLDSLWVAYQFAIDKSDGASIVELMLSSNGKIMGQTMFSKHGTGTLFSFDPVSHQFTKLMDFDRSTGQAFPGNRLIQEPCVSVDVTQQIELDVEFYPNPARNNVFIDVPDLEMSKVNIFNIEGASVLEFPNTNILDVSSLAPGIYLIEIKMKNRSNLIRKKLVVIE